MKEDNKTDKSEKSDNIYDCLKNCFNELEKNEKERKDEIKIFFDIKTNLNDNFNNISNQIFKVRNFEEFFELNLEKEEYLLIFDESYSIYFKYISFYIFGFLYSIIQLIGVQEMIIILNSLLNELIDELKIAILKTSREYNFYEVIKICSFKELPDIDVALITSFIGIIALKSLGYLITNLIFQLIPGIIFLLFFLFFEFHTGKELENNYTLSEIIILLLVYIFCYILVGGSSLITMKQIRNELVKLSILNENNNDNIDNNNNNKKSESQKSDNKSEIKNYDIIYELFSLSIFILLSGLSLIFTILLNKLLVFILNNNTNQKKFLFGLAGICIASCVISTICFSIHSCPLIKKNIKKKEENIFENQEIKNEEICLLSNNQINKNKKRINKGTQTNDIEDKDITNIKTCTLCGYLFYQKSKRDEKDICILYKYSGKWNWTKKNILKRINIIPCYMELLSQLLILGFKMKLSQKMYTSFSDWKNIGFLFYYIGINFFSAFFGCCFSACKSKINKENYGNCFIFSTIFVFICFLSSVSFITSLIYYKLDKHKGVWDYLYMLNVSTFKIIEFQLFSAFGVFNSNNIFDSSLLLNLERAIWGILETFLDNFEANSKKLVLVQIIFSSILGIPFSLIILIAILGAIFNICKGICGNEEQNKDSKKNGEKNVDIVEEYKLEEINIVQTEKRSINS